MGGERTGVTYQRLRQICNVDCEYDAFMGRGSSLILGYLFSVDQVPNFKSNAPGDLCDDQLSGHFDTVTQMCICD